MTSELQWGLAGYQSTIRRTIELGFDPLGVSEFVKTCANETKSHALVLRHDVDADLDAAMHLANIEEAMGVKSTYLVMLQSPLYNLFSRASCRAMDSIIKSGHEVGLHFDHAFNDAGSGDITGRIDNQARLISDFFSIPITSFSAHQPTSQALDPDHYQGSLISSYTDPQMRRLAYFSDSNRERSPSDLIELATQISASSVPQASGIQFLAHPMWWVYEQTDPSQVWDMVLKVNIDQAQEQLAATERVFGEPRSVSLVNSKIEGAESR